MKNFIKSRSIQAALIAGVLGIIGLAIFASVSNQVNNQNAKFSPILIGDSSTTVTYNLSGGDELLREYSGAASLYPDGSDMHVTYPLTIQGEPLYDLMKDTYVTSDGNFYYKCDQQSLETFKKAIGLNPQFPFSYFALAVCGKQSGSSDWKLYSQKALQIVQATTQIGGHRTEQDQLLQYLKEMQ